MLMRFGFRLILILLLVHLALPQIIVQHILITKSTIGNLSLEKQQWGLRR